jgi:hypothetical protein
MVVMYWARMGSMEKRRTKTGKARSLYGTMGRFWIEDWARPVDLPRFYAAGQTVSWFGGERFIMGSARRKQAWRGQRRAVPALTVAMKTLNGSNPSFLRTTASSGSKQVSWRGDCVRGTAAVGWRWRPQFQLPPGKARCGLARIRLLPLALGHARGPPAPKSLQLRFGQMLWRGGESALQQCQQIMTCVGRNSG